MKKAMPFLGASLTLLAASWSTVAKAQDAKPFQDVPTTHWAYEAVTDLQSKGIIIGYPSGFFIGKRALTRYEFAIALYRALKSLPATSTGPAGKDGANGADGAPGAAGSPGISPEDLQKLRDLITTFGGELRQLGVNVQDLTSRLDALTKDVAGIKNRLDRMIQWHADLFYGVRTNLSRTPFVDYSGAAQNADQAIFGNTASVHDLHVYGTGNVGSGVTANLDLVFSNYLSYHASNTLLGGYPAANRNGGAEQVTAYQANVNVPITAIGRNTSLQIGRFKNRNTALTYERPYTDAYFDIPDYNDNQYVGDGLKFEGRFGSARTSLWVTSYDSTATTSGALLNSPLVGSSNPFSRHQIGGITTNQFSLNGLGQFGINGVLGLNSLNGFNQFAGGALNSGLVPDRQQIQATQAAGIHVGVPLFRLGELGLSLLDFGSSGLNNINPALNTGFSNVVVYGANLTLRPIGRIGINLEGAKSVTQRGVFNIDGQNNDDNNAYIGNVTYASGPINVKLAYQYIDPRYAAPGFWNKIGNWYNPTNIQGPSGNVGYKINNRLSAYVGGGYYTGARNRPGNFTMGSSIAQGKAGIKFNVNRYLNVGADYEGVIYDLSTAVSGTGRRGKPVEQYITLGIGANLTSNTTFKVAYQLLNQQEVGSTYLGGTGTGTSNASVFTTQLAVHF